MQHFLGTVSNPAFLAYVFASLLLSLNLLSLWISSGVARARGGVAINPEDGARYGVRVAESDPPPVARYLRAHRNAEATTYPFLVLGLVYIMLGGSARIAVPIFLVFVV